MSKLDKRITKLYRLKNINSNELISILEALGFEYRGGKGSHSVYKHPKLPAAKLTVPLQRPLKAIYIKQALNLIEQLEELNND